MISATLSLIRSNRALMPSVIAVFSLASALTAETFRVDVEVGQDIISCGPEATPCASIQQAINLAVSGDTILVAVGTYLFNETLDLCPTDLTGVICVKNKRLTIRGGYDNGNWATSDPQTNVTIIDGQDVERGVLVVDTSGNFTAGLVMEGFTVRRGLGLTSGADPNAWGGGVFAKVANLTLRHMVIENNKAQGSDAASGAGGTGAGGGVAIKGNVNFQVTAVLENITLTGNTAKGGTGPERGGRAQGGGLWIYHANATGGGFVITNNTAQAENTSGDGVHDGSPGAQGGGIAFKQMSVSTFSNLTVTGNSANGGNASPVFGKAGGAFGGGLYGEIADYSVTDADILDNTATGGDADEGGMSFGGGTYSLNSDVTLERVRITKNLAQGGAGTTIKGSSGGGAGLYADDDGASGGRTIAITNSILTDNTVAFGSGGGSIGGGGGAIFLNGAQAVLTHCTLARNSLSTSPLVGRAIVLVTRSGSPTEPAHMDFDFGIISDHDIPGGATAAVEVVADSSITFATGLFANNDEDTSGLGTIDGLDTMTSATSVEYVSPGDPDHDYHLLPLSPAIGAATGSPTLLDFDAANRDGDPDLGADEYGAGFQTLTINKLGDGNGTISSAPAGINCGIVCSHEFDLSAPVTLSAVADPGSWFVEFGGHPDCLDGSVTLSEDISCDATFSMSFIFSDGFESGDTSAW